MHLKNLILLFFAFCFSSIKAGDGHASPVANFTVSNLCYKSITAFTNVSTGLENPVFQWTIYQQGNSVPIFTSSATDINFQFPAKTTYTVQLLLTNYVTPTHTHLDYMDKVILIDSIPIINFDFEPCQGLFTDLSCCTNSTLWDFGDGTPTSTLTAPVHNYTVAGNYTITLTVSNGTQTLITTETVTPYINFLTGNFNITYYSDTVRFDADLPTFDDSLRATFWDWEWDLGDGTTYDLLGLNGWSVKHRYQQYERDSIYTVSLTVIDPCYEVTNERQVLIKGIGKVVTSTVVFPSPVVFGYLNIESHEKDRLQEIKVIDCLGRRLDNLTVWDKPYGYYLWIDHIAEGVYTVQLVFPDRIENHKIIKQ